VFERIRRPAAAAAALWIATALAADLPPVTDPTAPPYEVPSGIVQESGEPLLLRSTHVSADSRSAVINDHVVVIGSRIDGAVVTAIEQGRVTLRRGAETIVLRLLLPPVKRAAKDAG
jgi:hypothetical protein